MKSRSLRSFLRVLLFLFLPLLILALRLYSLEKQRRLDHNPVYIESYRQKLEELRRQEKELEEQIAAAEQMNNDLLASFFSAEDPDGNNKNKRDEASRDLSGRREKYRAAMFLSGLETVRGAALEIKLSDAPGIAYGPDERRQIVHDRDLRDTVDTLKGLDPLGIAVNGERITALSKIVCNGPSVQVNRHFRPAPFMIEAVFSKAEDMRSAETYLEASCLIAEMRERGLGVTIEEREESELAGFKDHDWLREQLKRLQSEPPAEEETEKEETHS